MDRTGWTDEQHRIWVGEFDFHERTLEYFRHDFDHADDEPVSRFIADQGELYQDLDLFAIGYLETRDDLAASLQPFEYQQEVLAAIAARPDLRPTVWVAVPSDEVVSPRSVSAPGMELWYVGTFDLYPKVEATNDPLDSFKPGASVLNLGGRRTPMELGHMSDRIGAFTMMHRLRIGPTGLQSLPPAIRQARSLAELHIINNPIADLPDELEDLPNLRLVQMKRVGITTVPSVLLRLANLKTLDVSANGLTSLPDDWSAMQELETLDVQDNNLSTLPASLAALPNLATINAEGNPLSELPPELDGHPHISVVR